LHAAIAIAQSQKARSFELRGALSLAKLYRVANRDADAHAGAGRRAAALRLSERQTYTFCPGAECRRRG
jgi:hypothetical protein